MLKALRGGLFALAIATVACAQPTAPDPVATEVPVERFNTERRTFEFYSGFYQPERLVIRNQSAWQDVWVRIYKGPIPELPVPVVNFGGKAVIVTALGNRPHGGYGITITGASRTGSIVTVRFDTWSPAPLCGGGTQAETQPIDLVKLNLHSFDVVRFDETATVRNCG